MAWLDFTNCTLNKGPDYEELKHAAGPQVTLDFGEDDEENFKYPDTYLDDGQLQSLGKHSLHNLVIAKLQFSVIIQLGIDFSEIE